MTDHNHPAVRDWIATERERMDMMAQAIVALAPRTQPDPQAMSRRARRALARARKRTRQR